MTEAEAIARAVGRLQDDVDRLRAQRRADATVSLLRSLSEEVAVSEAAVDRDARSGTNRLATYDQDSYEFSEYSV
jgi:hypothetical protein